MLRLLSRRQLRPHQVLINLPQLSAELIVIDHAIETCPTFVVLVDHDVFKSVPVDERAEKWVYDTRGIWPDQPRQKDFGYVLRAAG